MTPRHSASRCRVSGLRLKAKMGKPELAQKIIEGKIAKYLKEVCLLDQSFVKDTTITINNYLKQENTKVLHFIRVELS